jgi:MFS transporter, BCD family, chlorophyll transporter
MTQHFSDSPTDNTQDWKDSPVAQSKPQLGVGQMIQLGLFQIGLGMMSVLLDGLLNRVMIKELGISGTVASLVIAVTLFVAPARIWIGQASDARPLWGKQHRTSYILTGAVCFAVMAFIAVQAMWQLGAAVKLAAFGGSAIAWTGLLAMIFGFYGMSIATSSTPFATLLVDTTDEAQRSKIVGIDWAMLTGGIAVGGILIKTLLNKLDQAPEGMDLLGQLQLLQSSVNGLFIVVPAIAVGLALVATWGIERKYSRFRPQVRAAGSAVGLKQAWDILTANRQTKTFFSFLIAMTLGLFLQNTILEPYGGDVFGMKPGETAMLNSFFGGGALVGILSSGWLLAPRLGKKRTAIVGCQLVVLTLAVIIAAGFTANPLFLKLGVGLFGLASGVTTTGAVTLMLDLTAAEMAGTFIGAWGLSQAFARGMSTVFGGVILDVGRSLFGQQLFAYGLVLVIQAISMMVAIGLLKQINVQEFKASGRENLANVIAMDQD